MDQRSGDGRFSGRFQIIALNSGLHSFPKFWDVRCEDCVRSEQDHPEFLLQKKSVWRNRKLRKKIGSFAENRSLTWSTTTSGLLALMIQFLIQFDTRWNENSVIYDQDPSWWRHGKLVQIDNTWVWSTPNRIGNVRHGSSSEGIGARLSKIENDGEEKHTSGTQTARLWRQKWEDWNRGGVSKSQGSKRCWERTTRVLSLRHKEVEVRRGKTTSEARVDLGSSFDSRAKTVWKVFAPNHLVTIAILPNVSSFSQNRFVNSAISARLHTGRLKVNPAKSRRRMVTKVQ